MPKKKKKKLPLPALKIIIVCILSLGVGLLICNQTIKFLKHSDYFVVKKIVIDPSLQFINKKYLTKIMGQNTFTVDLKAIERKLSLRYPQVSDLKVSRMFPDQIKIGAKERLPFAQTSIKDRTLTVDEKGVVLSTSSKQDKNLPFIFGVKEKRQKVVLGLPIKGVDVKAALNIISSFQKITALSSYRIIDIDIQDLSKINLVLSNNLNVYLDRDKIDKKMAILSFVLQKSDLDLTQVKYLDLRFKEPVIGKR